MALRQIIPYTDPRMRCVSAPVMGITDDVRALGFDMVQTMLAADGMGLAAIQVGVPLRLFTFINIPGATGLPTPDVMWAADKVILINPEIVERSDRMIAKPEGCLSMPGVFFPVDRHAEVTVEYTDIHGRQQQISGAGYKAICIQHEMDHLDGIRNVDRLSPLRRMRAETKFKNLVREKRRA